MHYDVWNGGFVEFVNVRLSLSPCCDTPRPSPTPLAQPPTIHQPTQRTNKKQVPWRRSAIAFTTDLYTHRAHQQPKEAATPPPPDDDTPTASLAALEQGPGGEGAVAEAAAVVCAPAVRRLALDARPGNAADVKVGLCRDVWGCVCSAVVVACRASTQHPHHPHHSQGHTITPPHRHPYNNQNKNTSQFDSSPPASSGPWTRPSDPRSRRRWSSTFVPSLVFRPTTGAS